MAYSLRVKDIKEETLVADNTQFLDVEVEILEDKKVVEVRKFGYPSGTTDKEVKADLDKFLKLFAKEQDDAVLDAEKEQKNAESKKTITNIKKLEINHDTPKKSGKK